MMLKLVAVLGLASCIVTPVMRFGGGKSAPQAQHETLAKFTPGRLSFEKRWNGPVMDAKIRIYADDEYRTQNRRWRDAFDDHLAYVNAVLGANFGVRLTADYRDWNRHAPGATLAQSLEALQELDAGDNVLTVVGLTSSLTLASATFEQLGYATVAGQHMVLRGYADLEERRSYTAAFPDLSPDERENALETMRRHKTASLFLHELGHNLGAEHEPITETLMSAFYSRNATGFSDSAHATIQRSLDERLRRASAEAPRSTTAAAPPKQQPKMIVVVIAGGAVVDGVSHEDDELDMLFSVQAGIDSETQVMVSKQRGVTSAAVADVIARLNAMGLKNVVFQ
jgi:hypothetical protein